MDIFEIWTEQFDEDWDSTVIDDDFCLWCATTSNVGESPRRLKLKQDTIYMFSLHYRNHREQRLHYRNHREQRALLVMSSCPLFEEIPRISEQFLTEWLHRLEGWVLWSIAWIKERNVWSWTALKQALTNLLKVICETVELQLIVIVARCYTNREAYRDRYQSETGTKGKQIAEKMQSFGEPGRC